jgi:hypothetical protein
MVMMYAFHYTCFQFLVLEVEIPMEFMKIIPCSCMLLFLDFGYLGDMLWIIKNRGGKELAIDDLGIALPQ